MDTKLKVGQKVPTFSIENQREELITDSLFLVVNTSFFSTLRMIHQAVLSKLVVYEIIIVR